jgi:hypothetical protein
VLLDRSALVLLVGDALVREERRDAQEHDQPGRDRGDRLEDVRGLYACSLLHLPAGARREVHDRADAGTAQRETDRRRQIRVEAGILAFGKTDVSDRELEARRGGFDGKTDERRQPLGQAGQLGCATGHDDAQQTGSGRLVAVIVERAADLIEQHAEWTLDRAAGTADELVPSWASWRLSASGFRRHVARRRSHQ